MLGERIGEGSGALVVQRVLPGAEGAARTETTQRGTGTLLGIAYQDMSTYESELRPDGTIYGEGNGIYMGAGGEVATWIGHGVGVMSEDGAVKYRGALYLYSTAESWRPLNKVAALFEYDVDSAGKFKYEIWEWK